jgi:hypothetical protein
MRFPFFVAHWRQLIRFPEPAMARPRGCRTCLVELDVIAMADGGAVLFCAACDTMGDERHVSGGARPWPAGMGQKRLKLVIDRPKSWSVKKISIAGKKSLTA